MNFEEKLNQFVERSADSFCLIGMDIDKEMVIHARLGWVKGSESLKPIVLKLYEGLKRYEMAAFQVKGEIFSVGSVAKEYIELVERMIGGEK